MFGRTGQMFPRRTFHDAMYEEEYGSEAEEDCCRGRGLSGIICWCFSVILLIGLAASVVLTVFFVIKSRSLIGGSGSGSGGIFDDLDIFSNYNRNKFEKDNENVRNNTSLPTTTTQEPQIDYDVTLSKDVFFDNEPFVPIVTKITRPTSTSSPAPPYPTRGFYEITNYMSTTMTTPTPPSPPSTSRPTKVTTTTTTTMTTTTTTEEAKHAFTTMVPQFEPPVTNHPNPISNEKYLEELPDLEVWSKEIENREPEMKRWIPIPTTTSRDSSEEEYLSSTTRAHVFFSLPPSSNRNVSQRRRPNRGPPITSFSTSTEKDQQRLLPPAEVEKSQKPIPSNPSRSSTSEQPPPTPTSRHDLLERIIKKLAPKFKNKTEIFSSRDRVVPLNSNYRIKTIIRTSTSSPELSTDSSEELDYNFPPLQNQHRNKSPDIMEEVEAPNLNEMKVKPMNSSTESSSVSDSKEFINILVGNEDTKRLITKETKSGVITSAILPPWFVNETDRDSTSVSSISSEENTNKTLPSNSTNSVINKEEDELSSPSLANDVKHARPGFGQMFMNMFNSNFENPELTKTQQQQPNRIGSLSGYATSPPFQPITDDHYQEPSNLSKRRTSFKDLLKELSPVFSKSTSPPSTLTTSTNGMLHYGREHMYGYPQDSQHHQPNQEPDDAESKSEEDEEKSETQSPSHIVEIAYNRNQRPEIIIEPEALPSTHEQDYDSSHHQEPLDSASEFHLQSIPPPPEFKSHSLSNMTQLKNTTTEASQFKILESILSQQKISPPNATQFEVYDFKEGHRSQEQRPQSHGKVNKLSDEIKKSEMFETHKEEYENESPGDEVEALDNSQEEDTEEGMTDIERIQTPITKDGEGDTPLTNEDDDPEDVDNLFLQRHPVNQLDETLYHRQTQFPPPPTTSITQSESSKENLRRQDHGTPPIKGNSNVYEVYATKYSPTVTLSPSTRITSEESQRNITSFFPPKPINFHSNAYGFKPSVSSFPNGFVPIVAHNWRPVLYEGDENQSNHKENPNRLQQPNGVQNYRSSPQIPFENPNPLQQPNGVQNYRPSPQIPFENPNPLQQPNGAQNYRPSPQIPFENSNGGRGGYAFTAGGGSVLPAFSEALKLRPTTTASNFDQHAEPTLHRANVFTPRTTKPPIIPSQPIPPPPVSNRIKFPVPPTSEEAMKEVSTMIDRSKYMHRPAPPPILMRRNPQDLRPNRRKEFRGPPYLTQHQQIQQQRMLKERLYQQQLARLRGRGEGGGNVQWPNEQPIRRNG